MAERELPEDLTLADVLIAVREMLAANAQCQLALLMPVYRAFKDVDAPVAEAILEVIVSTASLYKGDDFGAALGLALRSSGKSKQSSPLQDFMRKEKKDVKPS